VKEVLTTFGDYGGFFLKYKCLSALFSSSEMVAARTL